MAGDVYAGAIIHLSDIECGPHCRAEYPAATDGYRVMAEDLASDIKTIAIEEAKLTPEQIAVAISGDVVQNASADQYDKALRVITNLKEILRLPDENWAIVPGNHDVEWAACRQEFERASPALRPDVPADREKGARAVPQKLQNFNNFCQHVMGRPYGPPESVHHFPGFERIKVALVGLDTTWACTFCDDDNFGWNRDEPILVHGKRALQEAIGRDPSLIPIALFHHCPLTLKDESEKDNSFHRNGTDMVRWLNECGFRIALCGHLHRSRALYAEERSLRVWMTGPFGLDQEGLLSRYQNKIQFSYNQYQILLIHHDRSVTLKRRRALEPGLYRSEWDEDRGMSRRAEFTIGPDEAKFSSPSVTKLQKPKPLLHVSEAFPLPDGKYVVTMSMSRIADLGVSKVVYTAGGRVRESTDSAGKFFADIAVSDCSTQIRAEYFNDTKRLGSLHAKLTPPQK